MSSQATTLHPLRPPVSRRVESFDGTEIAFDFYDAPSRNVILIIPGFWRDRRHEAMQRFASELNGAGHRVAVCDLRGHGDSGGRFGFNLHEHFDVAAVARDLVEKCGAESVTLIGLSYGGAIAISTAARHSLPITSLLLISPVANFSQIAPRINLFTIHRHIAISQALRRPRFEWQFTRSAKLQALDDVTDVHVPVCLIHVKDDWLIGHAHSVALYEAANEPKELHVIDIPGSYHADRIFNVASDVVEPIIRDFLARWTTA